jgi:general secretion pathway protein E/type IV pilus assembly protein PilB
MAQRLVRKICSKCSETYTPSEREMRQLGALAGQVQDVELARGKGCVDCAYTGYKGRIGIFEIFVITEEVQHLIYEQVGSGELRNKARELGMRTLREDGLRKVIAGQTSLEEVFRVTMGDVD